jgi:hypothetical protein
MAEVTLKTVYTELQAVKNELRTVRYALMPVEKISVSERKEFHQCLARMQKGRERNFRDVFND